MLDRETCHRARLSRDHRFDGQFFTAVKTTGIFCRPVCPAAAPRECNVDYYATAIEAARAGYRPCFRCRPDSAPGSSAWRGVDTTLDRALRLIAEGALQHDSVTCFSARLGISDRYLRQLFQRRFGVSPKTYALYQQCMFAKQLLHQTRLSVTDVGYASGFRSIRRFNDCFKAHLGFSPSQLRRQSPPDGAELVLQLCYRPPYAWSTVRDFFMLRQIEGMEWIGNDHYGRTFAWQRARGHFTATHQPRHHRFSLALEIEDLKTMQSAVAAIRRILDLDADTQAIEAHLSATIPPLQLIEGLRLPGIWSVFEAGIRAILGQQVSVAAARRLVQTLVDELGEPLGGDRRYFPHPADIMNSDLAFLKIPTARRETLRQLARWHLSSDGPQEVTDWLAIKGIGQWTADYARMRGLSYPDIWLAGDLGVKRALGAFDGLNPQEAAPWRSYLTLQLWNR